LAAETAAVERRVGESPALAISIAAMNSYSAWSNLASLASNGDRMKHFDDCESFAPLGSRSKDNFS
jgi:hypothetical protein